MCSFLFFSFFLLTINSQNPTSALESFELLIEIKPNSSKAWYGKGKTLDTLSEAQKSNELLKEAIAAYVKAVEFGSLVDDETFKVYAERCIDRMRFIGEKFTFFIFFLFLIVNILRSAFKGGSSS